MKETVLPNLVHLHSRSNTNHAVAVRHYAHVQGRRPAAHVFFSLYLRFEQEVSFFVQIKEVKCFSTTKCSCLPDEK